MANEWPAVRFGPGGEEKVFNKPADVPKGWVDHPTKVKDSVEEAKQEKVTPVSNKQSVFTFQGETISRSDALDILQQNGYDVEDESTVTDEEITGALLEVESVDPEDVDVDFKSSSKLDDATTKPEPKSSEKSKKK